MKEGKDVIKVDIISGFLGAGKTTLIKKLLSELLKKEQVVLIENEFGEIGIDGVFLQEAGVEIKEMTSGCICCSLVGDFGKSLIEVIDTYHPTRIMIEPSGVGKLSDVIKAVEKVAENRELVINSASVIVDAKKCKVYMKNFGEFFSNQVEYAKTIILSRTQNMDKDKLYQCEKLLREYNTSAHIVTTPWNELSGNQILEAMEDTTNLEQELIAEVQEHYHSMGHGENCTCGCHEHNHKHDENCTCGGHDHKHEHEHKHEHNEDCTCGGHDHEHEHEHKHEHNEDCTCGGHDHEHEYEHEHDHHHAEDVFMSWGMETGRNYSEDELEQIMAQLANSLKYGTVLRAKGMVPSSEGENWKYFDLVPEEYEIRDGAAQYTGRICVIGSELKEQELKMLFGESI